MQKKKIYIVYNATIAKTWFYILPTTTKQLLRTLSKNGIVTALPVERYPAFYRFMRDAVLGKVKLYQKQNKISFKNYKKERRGAM